MLTMATVTRPGRRAVLRAVGRAAPPLLAVPVLIALLVYRRVRRAERAAIAFGVAARSRPIPPADAVAVLGAGAYNGRPGAELRARLDHALELWQASVAPRLVVSGGVTATADEGAVMREYLIAAGAHGDVVLRASPGANTRAQLAQLAQREEARYVVVSTPYHARRILEEARRHSLRATVSAPDHTPEMRLRRLYAVRLLSEVWALFWYTLPASWTARVRTGPGTIRHILPLVLAGRRSPRELLTVLKPTRA